VVGVGIRQFAAGLNPLAPRSPNSQQLWFLPLGGTGEIGMNLNLYGHDHTWLMVDCGLTFDAPLHREQDQDQHVTRYDLVAADPRFIVERRNQLAGIVITHAHEDHVGALPRMWERLRVPVYTTAFTADVLHRKLAERGLADQVPIQVIEPDTPFSVGPFDCRFERMTHSIPEPNALVISTPAGRVFHTGDWKLDPRPVVGTAVAPARMRGLGDLGIDAMVCDSTNALKPGYSVSEGDCEAGLLKLVSEAEGRVLVTCFGSNIARLITLARVAAKTGRYIGLFGRSLREMYRTAVRTGYWPEDCLIIDDRHLAYLPRHEVLAVSTGSQGEYRAALMRIANNQHPYFDLEKGDTVIFSAIVIPGNEDKIARLLEALEHKRVKVIQSQHTAIPIHASGHPHADELRQLYQWVTPALCVPTHGEPEHMAAHAAIARAAGVTRALTGLNGDVFQLSDPVLIHRNYAPVGRIAFEQS